MQRGKNVITWSADKLLFNSIQQYTNNQEHKISINDLCTHDLENLMQMQVFQVFVK